MKVTIENYRDIIPENEQSLCYGLLIDIEELNSMLEWKFNKQPNSLFIDYIDEHTQYSPERTDPCPDNFGLYRLIFEYDPYNSIGVPMTLNELDTTLCALVNFTEGI